MKKTKILLWIFMGIFAFTLVSSCNKDESKNNITSSDDKLMTALYKCGVTLSKSNFSETRVSCGIPQSGCITTANQNLNFQYSHPSYPGCIITVPALLKICKNAQGVPLSVNFEILGDVQTWTYNSSCNSLKNYWLNLYQTNQINTLETELVNLYKALSIYIETTYMQALCTVYQIKCPNKIIESNFTKRSCTSFCFSNSEGTIFIYEPQCGEACCVRRKTMCLDANNMIVITTVNFYQQGTCNDGLPNCSPGDGGGKICRTPCEFL